MKKKVRLKDIARLAGVSAGTVDRVLHNRGRVSKDALKKVMDVMKDIDYKPNIIARALGSNKTYHISALVPDPEVDPYWAQSMSGILQAEAEWAKYGVTVDYSLFNQYDRDSFLTAANAIFDHNPAGVMVAPLFYREALPYFKRFRELDLPYVLFNTFIPEAEPLSFVGQNLYRSGRLAGELMAIGQICPCTFAVLHVHEDIPNSPHLIEKEKGFREYFSDLTENGQEIVTLNLTDPDNPTFEEAVYSLAANKNLKGLFVSTSKAYSIAAILKKKNIKNIRLIGYDLLEENLHYLKEGLISFIINQNPKRQAFLGLTHLASSLVFKTQSPKTDLLPLGVITRENLQSYLHSNIR